MQVQSDSWLPQKTEVSYYLKIYAKGRAKIGGNNYLPEKLEHQPFMNCTMGRMDDVYLNSIRGIWSGEGFHVQSVTNKCGPKKALSSSTLAHQKENLSFKMIKTNKTLISDILSSPAHSAPRYELRQVPSCYLGLMRDASESLQTHGGGGRGLKHRCPACCKCQIQKAGSRPENLHSSTLICMTEIPWQGAKDTPLRHGFYGFFCIL